MMVPDKCTLLGRPRPWLPPPIVHVRGGERLPAALMQPLAPVWSRAARRHTLAGPA